MKMGNVLPAAKNYTVSFNYCVVFKAAFYCCSRQQSYSEGMNNYQIILNFMLLNFDLTVIISTAIL